jgi:hypothetical protein
MVTLGMVLTLAEIRNDHRLSNMIELVFLGLTFTYACLYGFLRFCLMRNFIIKLRDLNAYETALRNKWGENVFD